MTELLRRERQWWFRPKGPEMAKGILDHVTYLRNVDTGAEVAGRRERLVAQRAMYLDRQGPSSNLDGESRSGRSPYNVITGAVDSVHAKITTSRPRPQILSVGGRWKQQRKAKLLQRWIDGFYDQHRVYQKMSNAAQDAMIYDAAWVKVYGSGGRVQLERVWDGDLYIDPREERFPPIRTLYHVLAVDREALIHRFPKHKQAILDADMAPVEDSMPFTDLEIPSSAGAFVDMVTLIEAWRLGPCEDVPGLHVAAIGSGDGGHILHHEEWKQESFPFACFVWARDPERHRGQSFVERGAGVQMDLDEHADVLKAAYGSFVPRWAVPSSAQITTKDLGDDITVMVYDGEIAPSVLAPSAASPDFINREEKLAGRLHYVTGSSEMEASSVTPANLSSGRAILAHQDATSIRFLRQGQDFEQFSVDLANLILTTADSIASDKGAALDVYGTENGAELIKYSDVKMARSEYTIRVFPASKLPDTVGGRQEIIGQMMDRQIISDPLEARRLMDMPDLEREGDLAAAMREYADREIDRCLDGEQGVPTEYMDIEYAIRKAHLVLCDALSRGGEEDDPEAMECLRDFIGSAMAVRDGEAAMAEEAAAQEPTMMDDPAMGMEPAATDPMMGAEPVDPAMAAEGFPAA